MNARFVTRMSNQRIVHTMALKWALYELRGIDNARQRLFNGETITHNCYTYTIYNPRPINP